MGALLVQLFCGLQGRLPGGVLDLLVSAGQQKRGHEARIVLLNGNVQWIAGREAGRPRHGHGLEALRFQEDVDLFLGQLSHQLLSRTLPLAHRPAHGLLGRHPLGGLTLSELGLLAQALLLPGLHLHRMLMLQAKLLLGMLSLQALLLLGLLPAALLLFHALLIELLLLHPLLLALQLLLGGLVFRQGLRGTGTARKQGSPDDVDVDGVCSVVRGFKALALALAHDCRS
mmetsp:Transcript_13178/g.35454  ORF Transcript_13178/g.35454 Transcript_13178/m.35454 type:complete len:229 (+) Transcript_13178:331-1017(+)